jgi:hypothetical protein
VLSCLRYLSICSQLAHHICPLLIHSFELHQGWKRSISLYPWYINMAGPEDHLPGPFSDEQILALLTSISFPHPSSIRQLKVTALFHVIYVLSYNSEVLLPKLPSTGIKPTGTPVDLLLRIAGDHIQSLKTENESAILVKP